MKFVRYSDLNNTQIASYRQAIRDGFPNILSDSEGMAEYWPKLDQYSPMTQIFLLNEQDDVLGFMNTIPIFWDRPLDELPEEGWDWLAKKGLDDFRNNLKANCLGGLQIIVTKSNLGKGYSKLLIGEAKRLVAEMDFENFIIPIRPTFKHKHPEMTMNEYINLRKDDRIYDPWIRTHLNSGAQIIKICQNAMTIKGSLSFWEKIIGYEIVASGSYIVDGALNLVDIDVEQNHGVYIEPNIWISYT